MLPPLRIHNEWGGHFCSPFGKGGPEESQLERPRNTMLSQNCLPPEPSGGRNEAPWWVGPGRAEINQFG